LILKFAFLGLLYLFVYWVIRWVVVDVRGRTSDRPAAQASGSRRGKAPRAVTLFDERGAKLRTFPLDGAAVQIGRSEACQLRLDDTYASAFHARLFRRDDAWFLEDLGSTNGTFLNQRRVTEAVPVTVGDRVRIGTTLMELRR
jgi:pSer/pThr/pTyr-binding forkhead associated (FHA) protein